MSNPTSNFNWQMPTATDLVTDLPADFEVFGQAVDTALMDLKGGTTGQSLLKASATDMDFVWGSPAAPAAVGCALNNSADITVSNGAITQLTFNGELFDTNTMHDNAVNNERITVPAGQGGYYLWTTKLTWASNGTGSRQFIPFKNGTRQGGGSGPKGYDSLFEADGFTGVSVTFVIQLSAGDYVSMAVYQDSGGNLNVRAEELFQSLIKLGS
jgi:hypothetical protein